MNYLPLQTIPASKTVWNISIKTRLWAAFPGSHRRGWFFTSQSAVLRTIFQISLAERLGSWCGVIFGEGKVADVGIGYFHELDILLILNKRSSAWNRSIYGYSQFVIMIIIIIIIIKCMYLLCSYLSIVIQNLHWKWNVSRSLCNLFISCCSLMFS